MPGADYQHSADPVHSKASRDGEPRPPRTHKEHRQKDDPRDRNRREELQGPGDRSSLPPGSEYHPPEQRRMQDRHSRTRDQERARDGKEVNRDWSQQQRHVEDRRSDREEGSRQQRNMDDKIPDREDGSRDRYREDRSRDRYREDRSRDRYREDRSRDRVEKSRYQEEGTQDRHWEDRSQDKHWEKSRSRERDRYREERGQPLPRDPKEMNFHQESTYYNNGWEPPSLQCDHKVYQHQGGDVPFSMPEPSLGAETQNLRVTAAAISPPRFSCHEHKTKGCRREPVDL